MEFVERTIKIETIRRSVVECSKLSIPALKDRLIAECGAWWGTARRTAQEYLDELVNRDQIVIDGNDVYFEALMLSFFEFMLTWILTYTFI